MELLPQGDAQGPALYDVMGGATIENNYPIDLFCFKSQSYPTSTPINQQLPYSKIPRGGK